jgi:protein-L-isoaspartate O-methyltransferase
MKIKATFAALDRVYVARVRSPAVVQAFASVPREHFAGPGDEMPLLIEEIVDLRVN